MINKCQKDPTCGISLKRGMFMDNSESRMVVQGLVLNYFLVACSKTQISKYHGGWVICSHFQQISLIPVIFLPDPNFRAQREFSFL